MTRFGFLLASAAALLTVSGSQAEEKFALNSTQLVDGGVLPAKYAGAGGPRNCTGGNLSPPLRWSNPPKGTRSYTVVIIDMDGYGEPDGGGFIHWIAYGISASTRSLDEGEANSPSIKFLVGKNTLGTTTYAGPCPRVGKEGSHQYVVSVTALSIDGRDLKPGLTARELQDAIDPHYLGDAWLTVYYPGSTSKK